MAPIAERSGEVVALLYAGPVGEADEYLFAVGGDLVLWSGSVLSQLQRGKSFVNVDLKAGSEVSRGECGTHISRG